jgi:hypothetical protein
VCRTDASIGQFHHHWRRVIARYCQAGDQIGAVDPRDFNRALAA